MDSTNYIKHELWSTPVWEIHTGFDTKFNDELLRETLFCQPTKDGTQFNLWDYKTPRISELNAKIISLLKDSIGDYVPSTWVYNPILSRGWVNRQLPEQSLTLHDHHGCLLACTYYVKTYDKCGDLLLVDARGGGFFSQVREGNIQGVKSKRIRPEEGKLVIFPSYVIHMVETNLSKETRISISSNVSS
jgi:uncharacterized protein (TIGR02466 family)